VAAAPATAPGAQHELRRLKVTGVPTGTRGTALLRWCRAEAHDGFEHAWLDGNGLYLARYGSRESAEAAARTLTRVKFEGRALKFELCGVNGVV
jgi:hypothetical protein